MKLSAVEGPVAILCAAEVFLKCNVVPSHCINPGEFEIRTHVVLNIEERRRTSERVSSEAGSEKRSRVTYQGLAGRSADLEGPGCFDNHWTRVLKRSAEMVYSDPVDLCPENASTSGEK